MPQTYTTAVRQEGGSFQCAYIEEGQHNNMAVSVLGKSDQHQFIGPSTSKGKSWKRNQLQREAEKKRDTDNSKNSRISSGDNNNPSTSARQHSGTVARNGEELGNRKLVPDTTG